jgi:glycosyltransferase involved in cell wall biosynthesis
MVALTVHHFGPDPETVGGIATVIRLFAKHDLGADRVHAHPTWRPQAPLSSLRLAAAAASKIRELPAGTVVHVHLSERGAFLREGVLLALARSRGLVVIATLHGASFLPFAAKHPRLVRAVMRRAHLISCLDGTTRAAAQRIAPQVRYEIVPNPALRDESPVSADQTEELVVFAGEIGLRKGADVLHRAWQIVAQLRPNARCLMVGPAGDYAPALAERLRVHPPVDPAEMMNILRQARAVALPARAEGMPMVLTEAMSLGRPFVSTPVGGIPALAGAGGILVPVEDHEQLAERLSELLANPQLARAIGERGRAFCAQTRSVELLDARWRELYEAAEGPHS